MYTIESLTEFLGWCSVINIGMLTFSSIMVILFRVPASKIHAKMFNLNEKEVSSAYFRYLAQYKVAVIVLNVVPYFALKIME